MSLQETIPPPAVVARQGIRQPLITAVTMVTIASLVVYAPVLFKLVHDWWTLPDFSHGFFVPLFSAFVIWQKKIELAQVPVKPSWWGIAVLGAAMVMFLAGQLGAELFVSRISLLFAIGALVILLAGWRMFQALLFPWTLLFLMIPIPAIVFNQITFPLQLLASRVAALILPVLNVPVLREGNVITIPAMPLEVAEACSGIRSLMTLSTLAVMYSYFAEKVLWRRVVLVLASLPIAVVANASRVVGTGVCVQYWNAEKALGFFHEFSGWVLFMVALCLLYFVHLGLRKIGGEQA